MSRPRKPTATSSFGVGRREAHDASDFYSRFTPPKIDKSNDDIAGVIPIPEPFVCSDARSMVELPDASVALVVTSPPYFAGKDYELDLEDDQVPSNYLAYLEMLEDVFRECHRVLEPGGRIAVNVANLGRKPYRSLSADVIHILQDKLQMLLRGEVIWQKQEGSSGSCAWGTFKRAGNPVFRDMTERVIIASKDRFDRAVSVKERERQGLPHESTVASDEFMEATLDVWRIDAESARRVRHPAPFPVALPERLIGLYTYRDDLVLDPFAGSGSALVAAAKTGRRYIGYDLDYDYLAIARKRVRDAHHLVAEQESLPGVIEPDPESDQRPPSDPIAVEDLGFQARATQEGKAAQDLAAQVLEEAGFEIVLRNSRVRGLGLTVNIRAFDDHRDEWFFDVSGAFTTTNRGGLRRTDTVWKSIGRASVLSQAALGPVVLLTSHLPKPGSDGERALKQVGPDVVFDVLAMLDPCAVTQLATYAEHGTAAPSRAFWTKEDRARSL